MQNKRQNSKSCKIQGNRQKITKTTLGVLRVRLFIDQIPSDLCWERRKWVFYSLNAKNLCCWKIFTTERNQPGNKVFELSGYNCALFRLVRSWERRNFHRKRHSIIPVDYSRTAGGLNTLGDTQNSFSGPFALDYWNRTDARNWVNKKPLLGRWRSNIHNAMTRFLQFCADTYRPWIGIRLQLSGHTFQEQLISSKRDESNVDTCTYFDWVSSRMK